MPISREMISQTETYVGRAESEKEALEGPAKICSRRLAGNFISCDFFIVERNAYVSKIVNHQ